MCFGGSLGFTGLHYNIKGDSINMTLYSIVITRDLDFDVPLYVYNFPFTVNLYMHQP